ncbi:uncharacterized protein RAG0_13195 [Rhynchosporium agropyri]|uniref:Uncharacterized protein n=1 Tax=Rhynchosporium agropyri TaxID=914238 RepID=A0A1E1LDX0_9HELO|nr:uncharacterized protein RAG0_13195 [Rhynchosporium agropyri]
MSSSPHASVPTITSIVASPTPPEKSSQSPDGYFTSIPHTSGPVPPSENNTTSPIALSRSSTSLLTPPISEAQPRQERGGYFYSKAGGSLTRKDRTISSDHRSTSTLSPGLSPGGSLHSSETGRSPCSHSSGEYLSPPLLQDDEDKPPYISRRRSSDSLTMMKKRLRIEETIPNNRKTKGIRRRWRRYGCRHHRNTGHKHQEDFNWETSGCQNAPTATLGNKQLCRDHTGHFVPKSTRFGNTDTFGRLIFQSLPGPLRPAVIRRWSSVEVGAHQISLQSMFSPSQLPESFLVPGLDNGDYADRFISKGLQGRHRSSTFTRGAIDHDIVRVVRERLTFRKIDTDTETLLIPPLSITVRRASSASGFSGITKGLFDEERDSITGSGTETLIAQNQMEDRKPSSAYLLTSEDIESITLLIAENLRQNVQSHNLNRSSDKATSTALKTAKARRPFVSNAGAGQSEQVSVVRGIRAQQADIQGPADSHYLRVGGSKHPLKKTLKKAGTGGSVHEVIWNGSRNSRQSFGSSASDPEEDKPVYTSSEPEISPGMPLDEVNRDKLRDKGDAFDPNNARDSISEWTCKLPPSDVKMPVTSSDSDSIDHDPQAKIQKDKRRPLLRTVSSTPKERTATRVRPYPRYSASHEQIQDVFSFPPLVPRKATSEWLSPLPDMEIMSTVLAAPGPAFKSLYNLGVDVTIGPSGSTIFNAPVLQSVDVSPSQSPEVGLRPDYGFSSISSTEARTDDCRRKSVIKPHPKATARNGQTVAMGSSIGAHSRERRKSSVPRVQRVRTIDNAHKGKHDEPPSRWRPPSICPPRLSVGDVSLSPAEPEDMKRQTSEERIPELLTRLSRLRSGITDRITLVEAKSPPLPQSDCAGIYGTITGTLRKSIDVPCVPDKLRHSCNDCENSPGPSIDWIG